MVADEGMHVCTGSRYIFSYITYWNLCNFAKKNASEKHQWVVLLEKVSYLTLILPLPSPLYSSGSKEGVSSVNHLYNNIMYVWMEGSEWLVESCKAFKVIFCMYFI